MKVIYEQANKLPYLRLDPIGQTMNIVYNFVEEL